MISRRILIFIVFVLALCSVDALQPALPTSFYGPVIYEDGTPAEGIKIIASWTDNEGNSHTKETLTLSQEEANRKAQAEKAGYYFFTQGYILAAPATQIIITAPDSGDSFIVHADPGTRPFEIPDKITIHKGKGSSSGDWIQITNIKVTPSYDSAIIEWMTNTPTNPLISYGQRTTTNKVSSRRLSSAHALMLWGLSGSTQYIYVINSTLSDGTVSVTKSGKLITYQRPDKKPFLITDVSAEPDKRSARIIWKTDEGCEGAVVYSDESTPSLVKKEGRWTKSHDITINELEYATTYDYGVICIDKELGETDINGGTFYSFTTSGSTNQPQLPTVIYGKIISDGVPVEGTEVKAMWFSNDGTLKSTTTKTLTKKEAEKLGDVTLAGQFTFKDTQIITQQNSLVKVFPVEYDTIYTEVKAKPGEYVSITAPLDITRTDEKDDAQQNQIIMVPKEKGYGFTFKRSHLIIISIFAVMICGVLITMLVRHMQMRKMKSFIYKMVDKSIERQIGIGSLEDENKKSKLLTYLKTKMGLFLMGVMLHSSIRKEQFVAAHDTRVLLLLKKGETKSIEFVYEMNHRPLTIDVKEIYGDTATLKIDDVPIDVMLRMHQPEEIMFEIGPVRQIVFTLTAIRIRSGGFLAAQIMIRME
ncbi:hypothetical protein COV93_08705 [Candidatus Woesearchaeota archaeon CG11_big_fil_rev_8_21_14_0_20_43_8]|nr:MAG: hypothetical protein COV93_08705 [Candidatus Woesearchaeota archaeon CG11_big_fil_rev_8_21_14_0_20_43_8]PIO08912.1 MAG: hypothetical protein COT47_00650 [Candidatus Woesearchaeota archaeon CG08_land_8_20_14_0_20_43_7]